MLCYLLERWIFFFLTVVIYLGWGVVFACGGQNPIKLKLMDGMASQETNVLAHTDSEDHLYPALTDFSKVTPKFLQGLPAPL